MEDFVKEEDFPTLAEWLEDREVLYKERARSVRIIVWKVSCFVFSAW